MASFGCPCLRLKAAASQLLVEAPKDMGTMGYEGEETMPRTYIQRVDFIYI